VAAGGIASGAAVHAARVLGADLAYVGTRLIATAQSEADPDYKAMIVASSSDDVVHTAAFTGVPANFLAASIRRVGLDPQALPAPRGVWQPDLPEGLKAWRDVWSAGHGAGLVRDVPGVAEAVARLRTEYRASLEAARVAPAG
jgi:nitronate monooxygenase